jgi:xanthine dehydrogenase accessory factor
MKQWLETRQVLDRLEALSDGGRRAALATVVRVRGSAYRREGAKLLVAEDGSSTGNVSGGCLELDVREVALAVLRSGQAQLRTYCSATDEISAWDLGLGCEGQVEIFVEPVSEARTYERGRLSGRAPFSVCTVVAGAKDAVGRRMVVTSVSIDGSLGTTILDARVAERARELIREGRSSLEEQDGVTVFVESLLPPPQIVICGAGEDARPLAQSAATLGFQVTVVDRRSGLLADGRFPPEVTRVESDGERLLERVAIDSLCYAVVMTHNFADDRAYLRALVTTSAPYLGILGPRRRTERLLAHLDRDLALDDTKRARLHGPVGFDLGADGAEQVALAVLAEILAIHAGKDGRPLRDRKSSIHGRDDG